MKSSFFNKDSSIFVATFSHYEKGKRLPANGMVDPLLSFFLPKVKRVVLLDGPHPISDTVTPIVEVYSREKLEKRFSIRPIFYFPIYFLCKISSSSKTRISHKMRDFFSCLYLVLLQKEIYNLFIGLEAVYAFAGICLRKIGKIETVIYYVSDYSPKRFKNRLFNSLYLWLDRFCVKYADYTWDVSSAMLDARLKTGLSPNYSYKVLTVPNGLFKSQIASLPISERNSNELVYMGILEPDMGPDLAIKALKEVKKKVPGAKLHIIGGTGTGIKRLKNLASKLGIEDSVILYGFILNNDEMAEIIRKSVIGLAPYRSFYDSYRWYGDAGKIRQYMASGLPVVTTHVPPLGRFVAEKGAAIVVNDTVKDFSRGIIKLLINKELYKKMSHTAKILSKENTWENSYSNALKKMEKLIGSKRKNMRTKCWLSD